VSCPFGKKETEKFGFDITKVDKIFDMLLQEGHIKLSQFHTICRRAKEDEVLQVAQCNFT
jgi:hypothetical protein